MCQLCKNATFGLVLRSKKGFTDSFLKYLLSAYNVPGSCARPEDLMVNKNSPCSPELMVEWARKTFTRKFPQMNTLLQTEISALKATKLGGRAKEGWKSDVKVQLRSLRTVGYIQPHGNWMGTDSRTGWRSWNSGTRVVGGQRARRREEMRQEGKLEVEPCRACGSQVKNLNWRVLSWGDMCRLALQKRSPLATVWKAGWEEGQRRHRKVS